MYAQEWDCWIICQLYFPFFSEPPYCFPWWLYQFTFSPTAYGFSSPSNGDLLPIFAHLGSPDPDPPCRAAGPTLVPRTPRIFYHRLQWAGHRTTCPVNTSLDKNMHWAPSSRNHLAVFVCNSRRTLLFSSLSVWTTQCSTINAYTQSWYFFLSWCALTALDTVACFLGVGQAFSPSWSSCRAVSPVGDTH